MKLLIKMDDAISTCRYMYLAIKDSNVRAKIKAMQEKGNLCGLKSLALSKGHLLGIMSQHDMEHIEAELIISKANSHIDLTFSK